MLQQHDKAAEWLLIGFVKCWRMWQVASAIGVDTNSKEQMEALCAAAPFMPPDDRQNYARPVRAFVAAEWPKLADWLLKHESNPDAISRAAEQVKRLKAKGVRGCVRSKDDIREQRQTKKDLRAATTSYREHRSAFKTHGRSAWNTCKA